MIKIVADRGRHENQQIQFGEQIPQITQMNDAIHLRKKTRKVFSER